MAAIQVTTGRKFQGLEREAFGFQLLQKLGWSEGKGLGAAETGITKHIAPVRRQDQIGIGADSRCDSSAKVDFTANTHVYDQLLAGLNSHHAKPGAKARRAPRLQLAALTQRPQASKRRKTAGAEEPPPPPPAAAPAPARGRPQGRYARREAGKRASGYNAEDMSAILGVPHVAQPPAAAAAVVSVPRAAESDGDDDDDEAEEDAGAPLPGWWGASTFRYAGRMGSLKSRARKRGFCEDDQTAAFEAVTAAAVLGKKGLGKKAAVKEADGGKWAGTRVKLEEEEEEEEEAAAAPASAGVDDDAALRAAAAAAKQIKWKKHAEAALRKGGGTLKLAALEVAVFAAARVRTGPHHVAASAAALRRRLDASRRFLVTGGAVSLAK